VEVYDYREGIVTTLRYQDGAYILLQSGGMYRIPLFQCPEYKLFSSTEHDRKTARTGRFTEGDRLWREDNYKPRAASGWPPNIGYAKVQPKQRIEFDAALDSFTREPAPGPNRRDGR